MFKTEPCPHCRAPRYVNEPTITLASWQGFDPAPWKPAVRLEIKTPCCLAHLEALAAKYGDHPDLVREINKQKAFFTFV